MSPGGVQHIILAMPHRGRLNLLTELLEYSPMALFHKIKGGAEIPEDLGAEGDVVSHLGNLGFDVLRVAMGDIIYIQSHRQLWYTKVHKTRLRYLFCPIRLILVCISDLPHVQVHLNYTSEAVNPVALGKARAKQFSLLKNSPDDCKLGDKVMCVQLHGDASFTGQGVVMETLGLSKW